MHHKKKIFLYFIIIFYLALGLAYPAEPENGLNFDCYTLPNHMTVLFIQTPSSVFQTATALLTVKTGSVTEGKFTGKGVSHFLEHLLFKGTEDKNDTELARRVKALGGYVNAHTSFTETQYYIHLPVANIDKALAILSEMILQTNFTLEEFENEKNVILREMDMNDDNPSRFLSIKFFQTHYYKTPLSYPIIGLKKDFSSLTINDLKEYYAMAYQPSNMILTVCGHVDAERLKPLIQDLFGKTENRFFVQNSFSSIQRSIGQRTEVFTKPNLYSTKVMMGFKSCSINDPDLYPLDIAAEVLAGGASSRLQEKLLNKNLVSSVSSFNYTPEYEGVFVIQFELPGDNSPESIIGLILDEIESIKRSEINPTEIQRAIQRVSLDYAAGMEKNSDKAFRYTNSFLLTGTFNFPITYISALKTVTCDDVAGAAKHYLSRENLTIAVLKPEKNKDESTQKNEIKETPIPDVDRPELVALENGIRLILKGNEKSLATHIMIYLKGGAAFEKKNQGGLSYLTAQMLMRGTSQLNQQQLAEKIEILGGSCTPISGYNALGLSYTVLNENLSDAFFVLKDILTGATFPEAE
ncbi:MAG: insulinase family protein, partial [Candidatus Aureabacteria bacterium]|nr:insulinase family protein [Candidatus Auribacterota bacterium]